MHKRERNRFPSSYPIACPAFAKTRHASGVTALKSFWNSVKTSVEVRLDEFRKAWSTGTDEDVFAELAFCLFTPQSKASCCWAAVEKLAAVGLLTKGSPEKIAEVIGNVRFRNNKARYLVEARRLFTAGGKLSIREMLPLREGALHAREWLVRSVKGMGYKEASHFLRNTGFGENLAILDRHILKNLRLFGAIQGAPGQLNRKLYLETEESMRAFARKVQIPLGHLDLLLWCKETGEIFK